MIDLLGGKKWKDLIRRDSVLHDNFLFKLHHQANFAVVLFGVGFILGQNYLDGKAIQCIGAEAVKGYQEKYCWLHGSGHVPENLRKASNCYANQTEVTNKTDERHTRYYLWIPFILVLCLAIIKAPRVLWNEAFERGTTEGAVRGPDGQPQPADKIAGRFNKLRKRAAVFYLGFFLCEVLNILSVITCFTILNSLFGEKFFKYGSDFLSTGADPLCHLFPTVVSCTVYTGSVVRNTDTTSLLCLLSNNLFNQYYFLIIWFWWVSLLTLSALGLVYRLAQILVPGASQWVFLRRLEPHGVTLKELGKLEKFSPADFFLLGRICQNLKGSQIVDVLKELNKPTSKAKGEGKKAKETRLEREEEETEGNTEGEAMLTEVTTG